jgi:hypothetical protein
MDFIEVYERKFLRNDFIVCIVFSFLVFFFDHSFKWNIFVFIEPSFKIVYPAITANSVTVFVFLITCISIIIAFLQNKKMEQLADTDQPKTILKTFFSTIQWTGLLAFISFMASLPWSGVVKTVFFWGTFLLLVVSLARLIRIIWVIKILAYLLFSLKEHRQ